MTADQRTALAEKDRLSGFRRDGWVLLREVVPAADVRRLRETLTDLLGTPEDVAPVPLQRIVPRIVERDDGFAAIATDSGLLAELTRIFGVVPHLICSYGHEKPAGTEAHTGPHSDVDHLPGVPHDQSLLMVKVAVALTAVEADSGPTLIFPGSHRAAPSDDPQPLLMQPGDVLMFHANARHTATHNTSNRPRLGLWFVFALPWMRQFPGYEYSPTFLAGVKRRLDTEPALRHVFGLADPYTTRP